MGTTIDTIRTHNGYLEEAPIGGLYSLPIGPHSETILQPTFPSEADTLAYLDSLNQSNVNQWRTVEEVAENTASGSCHQAVNTAVLTALYLLGLLNLCTASPPSCCTSNVHSRWKRRSLYFGPQPIHRSLFSEVPIETFQSLPHISAPQGGRIPVHISVVDQVRKLWDSNPQLHSGIQCRNPSQSLRASYVSLSGMASGIILDYSVAQIQKCYPSYDLKNYNHSQVWLFPLTKEKSYHSQRQYMIRSLPSSIPVYGSDISENKCGRTSVQMVRGSCAPLLSSGPCPYMHWVVLNKESQLGECIPRLCPEGRIFVEHDQMCHSVKEDGFCPPDERLFMTAWGEPVCDCMDGMYHGPDGKCYRIFESAYCYERTVLQFNKETKKLICDQDPCYDKNSQRSFRDLPFAMNADGQCVQLGSAGSCQDLERFGFDVDDLAPACVSLQEAGLIRPQRSFQYSRMSFASSPNEGLPHYEVSYVILNGSTWELMMRNVDRSKRDTSNAANKGDGIKFIDTRNFPQTWDGILRNFESQLSSLGVSVNSTDSRTKREVSFKQFLLDKQVEAHFRKRPRGSHKKISFTSWQNSQPIVGRPNTEQDLGSGQTSFPEVLDDLKKIQIVEKVPQLYKSKKRHSLHENSQFPRKIRRKPGAGKKRQHRNKRGKSILKRYRRKYLRNRDRRQTRRLGKVIPGIITAPLLNQCRPGAKRDYNGHCRAKIIPESKAERKKGNEISEYQPTPPRIKCKKGTRLNSRGKCKKVYSGLG